MLDLLAQIRADQRARWARGERILIETYLERHPQLGTDEESVVDLIYSEYLLREEFGETPQLEDYVTRFPHHADSLRSQLELHALLQVTMPLEPPSAVTMLRSPGLDTEGRQRDQTPPVPDLPGARPPAELPVIPGYEVQGWLGTGGRGVVYRARQLSLDRVVALKMLRHELDAAGFDPLVQMQREARAAAELNDPHIVQVYDFGEHEGRPYFTMEYVAGGSLADRLKTGPLAPEEAVRLIEKLARALDAVHRKGIVHRDLKPGNVLLTPVGEPKVADFGLAKQLDAEASLNPSGAIVGTIGYMAPEQAAGKNREVGPAADVWALGAILYECLTGRPPFRWTNLLDTLYAVRHSEPPSPRRLRAGLPRDVETICLKCLEKDPRKRYASALALAADCAAYLKKEPIKARRRRWYEKLGRSVRRHPFVTAAAVLLLVAAVAVPLALDQFDQERSRREVEAALAAGKTYTLPEGQSLPGPLQWVLGGAGPPRPNLPDNGFSIETVDRGLLELVADPQQDAYRFSAWVRHDGSSGGDSFVGLYFGYRRVTSARGVRLAGYYTIRFADRGRGVTADANGLPTSKVELCYSTSVERQGVPPVAGESIPIRVKLFRPAEPGIWVGPWRRLIVTISPKGIDAFWEVEPGKGEPLFSAGIPQLEWPARYQRKINPETAALPAAFHPRQGLGLYVRAGIASFREVRLEPLMPNQ